MKKKLIVFSIILLVLMKALVLFSPLSKGNPPPSEIAPPADYSSGGPQMYLCSNISFISENVTFIVDERAQIYANYTFRNLKNISLNETLLLPFLSQPFGLKIWIGNSELEYNWTTFWMEHSLTIMVESIKQGVLMEVISLLTFKYGVVHRRNIKNVARYLQKQGFKVNEVNYDK